MSGRAYLNRTGTAVPPHDVHQTFIERVPLMLSDQRIQHVFARMAERCQIEHRYSVFRPSLHRDELDQDHVFAPESFPDTRRRMQLFEQYAPDLALRAIADLNLTQAERPTHLVVTTCTGFYAPGLDLQIVRRLGLGDDVERTFIGLWAATPQSAD